MESQFKEEYKALRKKVQEFAVGLVEQARTSYELEVCLNHNPGGIPWQPGLNLKNLVFYAKKFFLPKCDFLPNAHSIII